MLRLMSEMGKKKRTVIDIFISGPGDTSSYCSSVIHSVQSWNQRNGRERGIFFNCLSWEDLVPPGIGQSGQDVINQAVGDEYDIYLGMMWSRFGSPTDNAASGTEEEFDRAIRRHKSGEPIRVSFLFCTADIPQEILDGFQYAKVQEFKQKAQASGCLTRNFVDDATLINSINLILDKVANSWSASENTGSPHQEVGTASQDLVNVEDGSNEDDLRDAGMLDIIERFVESNSEYVQSVNAMTEQIEILGNGIGSETTKIEEISRFGNADPALLRQHVAAITAVLQEFVNWGEEEILNLEKVIENNSKIALKFIDISNDFENSKEDLMSAYQATNGLVDAIDEANETSSQLIESFNSLPRLDKRMNKVNRRVVAIIEAWQKKNALFRDDLELCASELEVRIEQS